MVSALYYAMGSAVTCVGGGLGLVAIHKLSNSGGRLPDEVVITLGGGALCLTLQAVSLFMEESSPFWKGFSVAVPILSLLTGKVIGRTVTQTSLAVQGSCVVVSKQFHNEMATSNWKDKAVLVASLVFVTSCPSVVATTFAPVLGGFLGMEQVARAAEKTREITKKSQ